MEKTTFKRSAHRSKLNDAKRLLLRSMANKILNMMNADGGSMTVTYSIEVEERDDFDTSGVYTLTATLEIT